jgi:hypothetical protein
VQIPLNIWSGNLTGELHVLKRDNKRKRIDPEDTTVVIALDTANLGKIESVIGVNKKNISINMRVENEETIKLIKESYGKLYNRLSSIGYKLVDMKYRIIDDELDLLNINKVVPNELKKHKKSLDIKI